MKRNARRVLSGLRRVKNSVFNIIFLRKRLQNAVMAKVSSSYGDPLAARILVNIDDDSKKMTVLKLGDLENDANAWEGEDDPFVHLSADERQEQLKKMRVQRYSTSRTTTSTKAKSLKRKREKHHRKHSKSQSRLILLVYYGKTCSKGRYSIQRKSVHKYIDEGMLGGWLQFVF